MGVRTEACLAVSWGVTSCRWLCSPRDLWAIDWVERSGRRLSQKAGSRPLHIEYSVGKHGGVCFDLHFAL